MSKGSSNTVLNAVLALIRGNLDTAREILRAPNSGIEDVPHTVAKVFAALDEIAMVSASRELIAILRQTMVIKPPPGVDVKAYLQGVVAVETLVNDRIKELSVLRKSLT